MAVLHDYLVGEKKEKSGSWNRYYTERAASPSFSFPDYKGAWCRMLTRLACATAQANLAPNRLVHRTGGFPSGADASFSQSVRSSLNVMPGT